MNGKRKLRLAGNGLRVARGGLATAPVLDEPDRRRAWWRKWYSLKRWADLRRAVLLRDGWTCRMCGRVGGPMVADHVVPHRGDERLFWDEGNIQALCKACHDGVKQAEEARG